MSFDKRIKNPKRNILCYLDVVSTTDAYKESLIGKRGFFANTLQEFAYLRGCHFKKLARIDLEADNEEYTTKYIIEMSSAVLSSKSKGIQMLLMIIPYIFICFTIVVGVGLGIESQDPSSEPCHMAFWTGVIVVIVCVCMAIHIGAYAAAAGV